MPPNLTLAYLQSASISPICGRGSCDGSIDSTSQGRSDHGETEQRSLIGVDVGVSRRDDRTRLGRKERRSLKGSYRVTSKAGEEKNA